MAPPAPYKEQRKQLVERLERKRWDEGTSWLKILGHDIKTIVHKELKELHKTVLFNVGITEENNCTDCTVQNALRCTTHGVCKRNPQGGCSFHKPDPQMTAKNCPKWICHRVQAEVERLMTKNRSPHWRNVDFAKLCRQDGWWELGKAALEDGFATDDPDSVDISGLLAIIMNVKSFDDVFDGKVSSQDTPLKQIRGIRNRLMHSSSKTCSEEDLESLEKAKIDILSPLNARHLTELWGFLYARQDPSHHKFVDELFEFAPEDHLILLEGVDEYWEMLRKHRGKSCRMDTGQILNELDVPDRCHVMLTSP